MSGPGEAHAGGPAGTERQVAAGPAWVERPGHETGAE